MEKRTLSVRDSFPFSLNRLAGMKALVAVFTVLIFSFASRAQSPGGVSGAAVWVRADSGLLQNAGNSSVTLANVPAATRSASSSLSGYSPSASVLGSATAWTAASSNSTQWLQLDLGSVRSIAGVALSGRADLAEWVSHFRIETSVDGVNFANPFGAPGKTIFNGIYSNTERANVPFPWVISTRFVRLYAVTWNNQVSVRADLILSFSGNSVSTDNTNVAWVINKAGNGDVFGTNRVAASSTQPSFRIDNANLVNFNPVLSFDGTNDFLQSGPGVLSASTGAGGAHFWVGRATAASSAVMLPFASFNPNATASYVPRSFIVAANTQFISDISDFTNGRLTFNNSAANETQSYHVWSSRMGSSGTVARELLLNGRRIASNASAAAAYDLSAYPFHFSLNVSNNTYWPGQQAEVIVFTQDLNALQRKQIESYLSIKYGRGLSADDNGNGTLNEVVSGSVREGDHVASDGSTIVWTANDGVAGTAPYQNNLAGIGRDDNGGLNQRQSQSMSSGPQLIMALGALAASNPANANSFAADRQYLVWGDNGNFNTLVNPLSGWTGLGARLPRTWRLQNTGACNQQVTVYFPVLSTRGLGGNPQLIYSTSASFAGGNPQASVAATGKATVNGSVYWTYTITWPNASVLYFTFAGQAAAPGGVTTPSLWLRADHGTSTSASGTGVQYWYNLGSATSNNPQQSTAGNQPVYTSAPAQLANFNPVLRFDGSSSYMSLDATQLPNGTAARSVFTSYALDASPSSGSNQVISWGGGAGGSSQGIAYGLRATSVPNVNWGNVAMSAASGTGTNATLFSNVWAGSGGNSSLFLNGATVAGPQVISGSTSTTQAMIGANTWGYCTCELFTGRLSEIIVYGRALTSGEQAQVHSYQALKYGVTLGTGTATSYVASDASTVWTGNPTYQNNVAGIGRDDASGLEQTQSQSAGSGSQLVLSLGSIAPTNAENANAFSANKQFLIWGDNNGSLTAITPVTGVSTINVRAQRVWRFQNTGAMYQSLTLYYPVSTLNTLFGSSTKYLYYGAAVGGNPPNTGTLVAAAGTTTIAGVSYYYFPVTFTAADYGGGVMYLSFAGKNIYPGGVPGSLFWVRADAGTSTTGNNTALSSWSDQSGNGNDLLQATAANQPGFRNNAADNINFNPVVNFNGSTNWMQDANGIFGSSTYASTSTFLVTTTTAIQSSKIINEPLSGNNWYGIYTPWSDGNAYWDGANNNRISAAWGGSLGVPYLWTGWNNASLNPSRTLYRNGQLLVSTTGQSSFTGNNSTLYFGAEGAAVNGHNGRVGEALIYGTALTATQRQQVESYLAIKYGLTMGTTGATVSYLASDATTTLWTGNATYQNNIAVIGRDDLSALTQKQSQSVNAGPQVILSVGTIAATNAANNNGVSADRQFLAWGDNNGTPAATALSGWASSTGRLNRIWRLQNTGSFNQQVTVYYPVASLRVLGGVPNLLVSDNATFNGAIKTEIARGATVVVKGTSYAAFTITFPAAQPVLYFTFGGKAANPGGVSTPALWLRADAGTSTITNGSGVNYWYSLWSTVGQVPEQGTAASQPVYSTNASHLANFNPVLRFDGYNTWMSLDASLLPNGTSARPTYASYALDASPSSGSNQIISWGGGGAGTGSTYGLRATGVPNADWGNTPMSAPSATGTSYSLFSNVWAGSGGASTLFLNGAVASGPTTISASTTTTQAFIGANAWNYCGCERFTGRLSELVVYSRALNATEQAQVNSYQAVKYGLTLGTSGSPLNYLASDGTTTYWNGTSNGAYHNNIAGIGRDDNTALDQEQSQSANSGTQLIMALGSIAATNIDNPAAFTSDKQYLVWGDNNASLASVLLVPGNTNITARTQRTWRLQNTGGMDQTVTVYFPVSTLNGQFGNATKYLYFAASVSSLDAATGSLVAASGTTTINGVSYYQFPVSFSGYASGVLYFSFAGKAVLPGGVAGARLWFRADKGVATAAGVSSWKNQGGLLSEYDLSQGTVSAQPLYNTTAGLLNFNPSLSFNGTSQFMKGGDGNGTDLRANTHTLFSVVQHNNNTSVQDYLSVNNYAGNNAGVMEFRSNSGSLEFLKNNGSSVTAVYSSGSVQTPLSLYDVLMTGTSAGTVQRNGVAVSTSVSGTLSNASAANMIGVGCRTTGAAGSSNDFLMNGLMGELVEYGATLTNSQRVQVQSYLGIKYGLSLGSTGAAVDYLASNGTTVTWNGSANSTYQNNIAGIGRDDLTGLTQKQGQNSNGGSQVLITLGSYFVSNSTNPNSIPSDRQFLVWGDNNGALAATSLGGWTNSTARLARIWRLQNTGSFSQPVTVYYPAATLRVMGGTPYLLVSDNAGFNGTLKTEVVRSSNLTINGTLYAAFTISFPSAQSVLYFSFGGKMANPGGINNSVIWLRADAGASAANWQNMAPAQPGNDATQAWAGQQPVPNNTTKLLNFNPSMVFSGGQYMFMPTAVAMSGSTARTVFTALNSNTTATRNVPYTFGTGGGNNCPGVTYYNWFYPNYTTNSSQMGLTWNGTQGGVDNNFKHPVGTTMLTAADYAGTQTTNYQNGISGATTTLPQALNTAGNQQPVIGAYRDNDGLGCGVQYTGYTGSFGEMVSFHSQLSAADRLRVFSYLATKYGATLGSAASPVNYTASDGTTTFWTGNATYQNNIAGIGRDDNTALDQEQSQSTNSGSQVVIALGALASNNPSNPAWFASDKQFLVWGDNNSALTSVVPLSSWPNAVQRMARVWRLQNTGAVSQQVTVYFPVSGFSALAGLPYLIYGTDANFSAAATEVASNGQVSVNGVSYYAFPVTFSGFSGGVLYYSFGSKTILPGGVTGSRLWYRADMGVSTSTGVSYWKNQGTAASEYDVAQSTAGAQPVYNTAGAGLFNYNPTLGFNGTSQFLRGGSGSTSNLAVNANSVFSVVKHTGTTGGQDYLSMNNYGGSGNGFWEYRANGTTLEFGKVSLGSNYVTAANTVNTNINLHDMVQSSTTAGTIQRNGVDQPVSVAGTLVNTAAVNSIAIGARTWGVNAVTNDLLMNGGIGEIVEFGRSLSATERRQVQSYLGVKYGVTLGSNGSGYDYLSSDGSTTIWSGTSKPAFHNNVAGIGRDDVSGLLQKQSATSNAVANKVTMALGTLAGTNWDNAGSFTADRSFVLWGDDGASATTTQTTNLPSGIAACAERVRRSWRVQRTGTSPTGVQVTIDLSGLTNATGTAIGSISVDDIDLLIDGDGDGLFTGNYRQYDAVSNANGIVVFNNVQWDVDGNGSDVFTVVLNKTTYLLSPRAINAGSSMSAMMQNCTDNGGFLQFAATSAGSTEALIKIKPDPTSLPVYTFGSGVTVQNNNPVVNNQRKTDGGQNTTTLSNLMYYVPAGSVTSGSYTVRLYYDANDSASAVGNLDPAVPGTVKSRWYKLEGTPQDVLADQIAGNTGFSGAHAFQFLTPTVYGIEKGVRYVEFNNITSFSTFGFMAARNNTFNPLPIVWTSFHVTAQSDCSAQLDWSTAYEQNSARYEVEYSTDGIHFTMLASLPSHNSASGSSYRYVHRLQERRETFFRIRAVDHDGRFTLSAVRRVSASCSIVAEPLSLYPNPAHAQVTVVGLKPGMRLLLTDTQGNLLGTYLATGNTVSCAVDHLPAGVYLLRVSENGDTGRVLKFTRL